MKLMIASDIHGSAYYCEKLIEAWKRENPEKLLLLGDILYHGPRNDLPKDYAPKKVISMLNEMKNDLLCVRGNCEAEVDQMVLEFPIMAEYAILTDGAQVVFATHGHKWNLNHLPPLRSNDILLHGHTHIPCRVCAPNGTMVLNPGSATLPKEKSHHGYMTWENGVFIWKDFDGNEIMKYEM
jgi:putative phosphoesterase